MITTDEMDGIYTEQDRENRDTVVLQCRQCRKWTTHYSWETLKGSQLVPCANCDQIDYDRTSIKSLRSHNPLADNKRRPK